MKRIIFVAAATVLLVVGSAQTPVSDPPAAAEFVADANPSATMAVGYAAYKILDSEVAGAATGGAVGGAAAAAGWEVGKRFLFTGVKWGSRIGLSVGGLAGAAVGGLAGAL